MTVIPALFLKLRAPENVARYMSKKSRLKGHFDRQHRKLGEALFRSRTQDCYHMY